MILIKYLNPLLFSFAIIILSRCSNIGHTHTLDDKFKKGLHFNIEHSYDYKHELFEPQLEYQESKDSINIELSYIESGGPTFDGSYRIDNDTLFLLLQDIEPDIELALEEFLTIHYNIHKPLPSYSAIKLERRYANRSEFDMYGIK